MKLPTFFLPAILALAMMTACNSAKTLSGEVRYLGPTETGTVHVSAAGYGPTGQAAVKNAEINAVRTLLFRGIPGSQYHLPMIPNEAEARKAHGAYLNKLLETEYYKQFLVASNPGTFSPVRKRSQNINVHVLLHVDALRRDLEQNKVIRKFGI